MTNTKRITKAVAKARRLARDKPDDCCAIVRRRIANPLLNGIYDQQQGTLPGPVARYQASCLIQTAVLAPIDASCDADGRDAIDPTPLGMYLLLADLVSAPGLLDAYTAAIRETARRHMYGGRLALLALPLEAVPCKEAPGIALTAMSQLADPGVDGLGADSAGRLDHSLTAAALGHVAHPAGPDGTTPSEACRRLAQALETLQGDDNGRIRP